MTPTINEDDAQISDRELPAISFEEFQREAQNTLFREDAV
jgi:hypothetical protein